jgi:GntR family transcriptional regulator/MocR family aminotransferase
LALADHNGHRQDALTGGVQLFRPTGITLNASNGEPLYRQIVDQVIDRVRSGAFPPGYRLPPTRTLARELDAHRNTVVRAFEELQSAGFLVSVVGRGTFVTEEPPAEVPASPPARSGMPWGSLVSRAARAEPLGRADVWARPAPLRDTVDLSRMQPGEDLLPHEALRRCLDHVLRSKGAAALAYAPREGLPKLRELIVEDLARLGVPARAEDVLITTGSQQALDLVARALIDPGDTFLVEDATYSGAINLLAAAGARVVGVRSDADGPELASLEQHARGGAKGFYLMPNCGNPTGSCVSARRREELVAWSHRAGVPLVEDDYGADLNLEGDAPPVALRALSSDVIYVATFSKKLIPALRVGFMVCPESLRKDILPLKHTMDLGTSVLLQHALCEFLERGYLRAHLRKSVPEYRARRDALAEALVQSLPDDVEWTPPRRGLVLWLTLPDWMDPTAVYEEARRHGVLVTPGVLYSASGRDRHAVRLAFCGEPAERLAEGARRLGRALRELRPARGAERRAVSRPAPLV